MYGSARREPASCGCSWLSGGWATARAWTDGLFPQFRTYLIDAARDPCKTVGSAYVGSNPTPATTNPRSDMVRCDPGCLRRERSEIPLPQLLRAGETGVRPGQRGGAAIRRQSWPPGELSGVAEPWLSDDRSQIPRQGTVLFGVPRQHRCLELSHALNPGRLPGLVRESD